MLTWELYKLQIERKTIWLRKNKCTQVTWKTMWNMCDYFNMFTVQHTNLSDEAEIKSKSPLLLPRNKNKRKPKKENHSTTVRFHPSYQTNTNIFSYWKTKMLQDQKCFTTRIHICIKLLKYFRTSRAFHTLTSRNI